MGFIPHHIGGSADDVASPQPGGRVFLLPGSPARARAIAERLEDARCLPSPRGHDVHVGTYTSGARSVDVGVVSSGMGCPSLGIVARELMAFGVQRIARVGSAGSLQKDILPGHVVVATGAVRDEGASDAYAPAGFPAVPAQGAVRALEAAAREHLPREAVHLGLVHSKDSLYGREFGDGPLHASNEAYLEVLAHLGVAASEMEASHLFVLAQAHGVEAGCVLGILGGPELDSTAAERKLAEERAIQVGLEAALVWRHADAAG